MKTKTFPVALLIAFFAIVIGNSALVFAAPDQKNNAISWYHKYLGKECYQGAYSRGSVQSFIQSAAGTGELLTAASRLHVNGIDKAFLGATDSVKRGSARITGNGLVALLLSVDGIGRIFGGHCAGITGVDDFVLKPLLSGAEFVYDKTTDGSKKKEERSNQNFATEQKPQVDLESQVFQGR